ncbi:hypothetical protein RB597_010462 [Gaeumannomyces tritici]
MAATRGRLCAVSITVSFDVVGQFPQLSPPTRSSFSSLTISAMMFSSSESAFYNAALVAALVSPWGVMTWNGDVAALAIAAWTGKLDGGSVLTTKYTGIPGLDFGLAMLVAFFYSGTDDSDEVSSLALIDGFTSLQSLYIWMHSENALRQQLPRLRRETTTVKTYLVDSGSATAWWSSHFPYLLFCAVNVTSSPRRRRSCQAIREQKLRVGYCFRKGPPFEFLPGRRPASRALGVARLATVESAPTLCRGGITILSPVWVSVLHRLFTAVQLPWLRTSPTGLGTTIRGLRTAYVFTTIVAAAAHMYAIRGLVEIGCAASAEKYAAGVSTWSILARAYIPSPFHKSTETGRKLLDGPRLFLLHGCAIMLLVSLVWAYFEVLSVVEVTATPRLRTKVAVTLALFAVYIVLGSGCTVCLVLYWREGILLHRVEMGRKTPT